MGDATVSYGVAVGTQASEDLGSDAAYLWCFAGGGGVPAECLSGIVSGSS